ncbi:MAG: hypothetical protein AAF723_10710, partial [Pseudomonadota bacterium]
CLVQGGGAASSPTPTPEEETKLVEENDQKNDNAGTAPVADAPAPEQPPVTLPPASEPTEVAETEDDANDDFPFHGERTPITPMTGVTVQAGMGAGSWLPSGTWLNQMNMSGPWRPNSKKDDALKRNVHFNQYGMPSVKEGEEQPIFSTSMLWSATNRMTSKDVAGTWELTIPEGVKLRFSKRKGVNILNRDDRKVIFQCTEDVSCAVRPQIISAPKDAKPFTLIQLTDGKGRRLSDKEGLEKGYVTREPWRKAMWGYGDLRAMNSSAVLTKGPGVIRYDEFPDMTHVGWQNIAKRFTENGKLGAYDIKAQTGVKKIASPVVARLKAAWEIGAVYHHNLPHLFLEHRGNINPEVIGQWAVDLWADQSIPLESKLAIFNDNELDHI